MDLLALRDERQRLADEFRSTMTCLSMFRAQHLGCADADARQQLASTIEEQSAKARQLGARLLEIDASMLKMQARKAPPSPLELSTTRLLKRIGPRLSTRATSTRTVLNSCAADQAHEDLECAMQEARIELLQRMPIFGGIRADILQFLLGFCPIVSVPTSEFFFREHQQGDSMFVLERGKAAVLKSWRGEDYLLKTLSEGDCFGEMAVMDHCPRSADLRRARPMARATCRAGRGTLRGSPCRRRSRPRREARDCSCRFRRSAAVWRRDREPGRSATLSPILAIHDEVRCVASGFWRRCEIRSATAL